MARHRLADWTPVGRANGRVGSDAGTDTGTAEDGTATLAVGLSLRANQQEGDARTRRDTPAGSGYHDQRRNTRVLVVRG
ncbi:MAG: hypothetical protein ABEJ34_00950 [Haloferacaceae archaeon]